MSSGGREELSDGEKMRDGLGSAGGRPGEPSNGGREGELIGGMGGAPNELSGGAPAEDELTGGMGGVPSELSGGGTAGGATTEETLTCDEKACSILGGHCDEIRSACVAGNFDLYVNAAAPNDDSVDGSFRRPFRTISAALEAAAELESPRIHVAPGLYDSELGERFPLEVPGGVSLEGAGEDRTTISGTGPYNQELFGGSHNFSAHPTLVIGDPQRTTHVSGLWLKPGLDTGPRYYGVFCNRGNAAAADEPLSSPNTELSHLHIGPYYNNGIVVVGSAHPQETGCNLRLTSSHIEGVASGIAAGGCNSPAAQSEIPVALALGDGTDAGGNLFSNISIPEVTAESVSLYDCVSHFSAHSNRFVSSDSGISIAQPLRAPARFNHISLIGNRFEHLSNYGVLLRGGAVKVTEFRGNTFSRISSRPKLREFSGVGLIVEGYYEDASDEIAEMPQLGRVRQNSFFGNDIGLMYRWASLPENFEIDDFGMPGDPGGNEFRCNSAGVRTGYDVYLYILSATPINFKFAGNIWDHPSPQVTFDEPPDGIDVAMIRPNTIDVSGAQTGSTPCPTDTQD